eukprot:CAMPEP_0174266940 /NCGR_PEP_ID=MMETSP0439-20130205/31939_1 /TAXON_ID=0 /ORGANISM="Stereomyxa ramosa, Strain Chinc5" /LENGTH=424 /DNA_ID=CAMNT_0015354201 /DNA_START=773 /DNA_END=2047 /DNA_ORIENTATION=+
MDFFPLAAVFVLLQLYYVLNAPHLVRPVGAIFAIVFIGGMMAGVLTIPPGLAAFMAHIRSAAGGSWVTFFKDLHLLLFLVPAGILFCLRKPTGVNNFFTVFGASGFLLSTICTHYSPAFFPSAAVLGSFGFVVTLKSFLRNQDKPLRKSISKPVSKENNVAVICGLFAIAGFFILYSVSTSSHYATFQVVTTLPSFDHTINHFQWIDDFRETAAWTENNMAESTTFASWTGYSHGISVMKRKSILGSNILLPENVEVAVRLLELDEKSAASLASELGVTHLIVYFGGRTGIPNDDVFHLTQHMASLENQSDVMESVGIKAAYHRYSELGVYVPSKGQELPGFDLARGTTVPPTTMLYFTEVFTSTHWMFRIYEVPLPEEIELVDKALAMKAREQQTQVKEQGQQEPEQLDQQQELPKVEQEVVL